MFRLKSERATRMAKIHYPGTRVKDLFIMFYYVYLIQSKKTRDLYVGYTADLKKRLIEHNKEKNFSTKSKIPWELIHYEAYKNEKDAMRREKYLKTSQGARLFKRMLKEYFYEQKESL